MATAVWRSLRLPTTIASRQAATFAFRHFRPFAQVVGGINNNTNKPSRRQIDPLKFPSIGYEAVPDDEVIDEEQGNDTELSDYYPAKIGEIFQDRYQIIAKVGYGGSATVWLGKDLLKNKYVAIKICIHNLARDRELEFHKYLKNAPCSCDHDEYARGFIREMYSSFSVYGPHGKHTVMILQPTQTSFFVSGELHKDEQDYLDEKYVKCTILALLHSVYYLHARVGCVHTNIHSANILANAEDDEFFRLTEERALEIPPEGKQAGDHTIYRAFYYKHPPGRVLLAGFSHLHLGLGPHTRPNIMPIQLRAPEIILKQPWTWPVDVWSIGHLAWEMMQDSILFPSCGKQWDLCTRVSDSKYDAVHLAEMVAALGPPPASLLDWNPKRASEFWRREEDGSGGSKWTWASKEAQIPVERTLEAMQTKLENPTLFLQFIRRALTWDPDERPTAEDLVDDPWFDDLDDADDDEDDGERVKCKQFRE